MVSYSALASEPDAQRELEDAFESDNEDDHDEALLQQPTRPTIPGTYDFERDYDYIVPPAGSPPSPTAFARPNDFGNSNGLLPATPVRAAPSQSRPGFFRRVVGAVLPSHYQYESLPTSESFQRTRGSGTNNDGVFANVTAKPSRATVVHTENGDVHLVPEESQKDVPPVCTLMLNITIPYSLQSYQAAQLDAAPPYMATIHAPPSLDFGTDMIIEDLPSGSVWSFFINLSISFFLQFVGFLLSYVPDPTLSSFLTLTDTCFIPLMPQSMVPVQDWASLSSSTDFIPEQMSLRISPPLNHPSGKMPQTPTS